MELLDYLRKEAERKKRMTAEGWEPVAKVLGENGAVVSAEFQFERDGDETAIVIEYVKIWDLVGGEASCVVLNRYEAENLLEFLQQAFGREKVSDSRK